MSKDFEKAISIFNDPDKYHDIERAKLSIKKALPTTGIIYEDGLVIISQNWSGKESKLVNKKDIRHVRKMTDRIGASFVGRDSDGIRLMNSFQDNLIDKYKQYDEVPDLYHNMEMLVEEIENNNLRITNRIFGVGLIIGGYDNRDKPLLYYISPDGKITSWSAFYAGTNKKSGMEIIESEYDEKLDFDDSVTIAVRAIKSDNQDHSPEDFQGCRITKENGYKKIQTQKFDEALNKAGDQNE